jgi:hypothetical protein
MNESESEEALKMLRFTQNAFNEYCKVDQASDLSPNSQTTYQDMAGNFGRWLKGEFNPGSRKAPYRINDTKTEKTG